MNRLHLQLVRSMTASVLADMEATPHLLDAERVMEEYVDTTEELARLDIELQQITGGINLGSGKQLGDFIYDTLRVKELPNNRTDADARRTDQPTLHQLNLTNAKQRRFFDLYFRFTKLADAKSKYLETFREVVEHRDCKLYGSLLQCTTATHRLSSAGEKIDVNGTERGTQLQNLPRSFKRLFTAPPGYVIGEADGAQLEFRVAAELGNDEVARQDIRDRADVHANTAAAFVAAGDPKFTSVDDPKERRQLAKAQTFKPLYGGKGSTRFEKAYVAFFNKRYSGVAGTQRGWTEDVLRSKLKACKLPYGMIYYYPQARMSGSGYIEGTTQMYNYPIQGFATGEIIPITLICFWLRADPAKFTLVSTIHDSIKTWVKEGSEEEFHALARQTFTIDVVNFLRRVYNYNFSTPLGCGVKIAKHWGEGEETTYDFDPVTEQMTVKVGKEWRIFDEVV